MHVLSVGYHCTKLEKQTTYVGALVVFSSDAGSTPAISTLGALMGFHESVSVPTLSSEPAENPDQKCYTKSNSLSRQAQETTLCSLTI